MGQRAEPAPHSNGKDSQTLPLCPHDPLAGVLANTNSYLTDDRGEHSVSNHKMQRELESTVLISVTSLSDSFVSQEHLVIYYDLAWDLL